MCIAILEFGLNKCLIYLVEKLEEGVVDVLSLIKERVVLYDEILVERLHVVDFEVVLLLFLDHVDFLSVHAFHHEVYVHFLASCGFH